MTKEQQMFDALKRIGKYQYPDTLRRNSEKLYGLEYEEALEMAYENVLNDARAAVHGMRRPKDPTLPAKRA